MPPGIGHKPLLAFSSGLRGAGMAICNIIAANEKHYISFPSLRLEIVFPVRLELVSIFI
jgi:hypothetical protein